MTQVKRRPFIVEGQLFYPWKGQVRFQASLVGEELVLIEGDEKHNHVFENHRAPTVRQFKEKDRELFKDVLWEIKQYIKGHKFAPLELSAIALPVKFNGPMREFTGGARAQVYVQLMSFFADQKE